MVSDALWAITCYFNPVGYRQKYTNYRLFRDHLRLPLVTIELSFHRGFDLGEDDADILIQRSSYDVLWHKERLLNLALEHVPCHCRKIAWLDCDVIFTREDWSEACRQILDHRPMAQPFGSLCDLAGIGLPPAPLSATHATAYSLGFELNTGRSPAELFRLPLTRPGQRHCAWGFAWAARRELLEEHGLYDVCILGGADRAITGAACGEFDSAVESLIMNARQRDHYMAWAEPFFTAVRGRIGYVDGTLMHLWHGDLRNRRYRERHQELATFQFDPCTDIALDAQGIWRWSSDKLDMHSFVQRYFAARREDGCEHV